MSDADPFGLDRFVTAQEGTYDRALAELRRGRKTSHWMWFVLPQVQGLGRSPTAQRYAVTGLAEARAYLDHPVLGPRLRQCATTLLDLAAAATRAGRRPDAVAVLDEPDATKLRSCMTLFALAAADDGSTPARDGVFQQVLDTYFDGTLDPATVARLPPV